MLTSDIKKAICLQKHMIRSAGYEPTWKLFSNTFGWHQIQKKISPKTQELYQKIWEQTK